MKKDRNNLIKNKIFWIRYKIFCNIFKINIHLQDKHSFKTNFENFY